MIGRIRTPLRSLALCAAIGLLACGGDDEDAAPRIPLLEQNVGAAGATLDVPGTGVRLVIPAGALSADVTISVSEATRAPRDVLGRALEFGPDGTQFALPVELTFTFEAADVSGSTLPDDFRLVTWNAGVWEEVEGATLEASSAHAAGSVLAPLEHFSTYAVMRVNGADALLGTFGTAGDDVYALGNGLDGNGVLARWDGSAVGTVRTLNAGRFVDGWAASPTDRYALGYDGTGRVFTSNDGSTWTESTTHAQALLSIHGIGNERIAVGYDQTILEFDGATWTDASIGTLLPGQTRRKIFRGVAMTAAGEAILVGDDVMMERSGGSWQVVDLGALFVDRYSLRSVWARTADDVWVTGWEFVAGVGNRGVVLHFDGIEWTREFVVGAPNLRGIAGGPNDVYAVGDAGTLLRKQGTWSAQTALTTATLYDVWCADDTTLAFVGSEGVFHYPGRDVGTGGSGDCTGSPTTVLDFRTGAGLHECNVGWSMQGFPMQIRSQVPGQMAECAIAATQGLCLGNDDYSEFGPNYTSMWFTSCDRLVIDLTLEPTALGCVEIDVRDFCDDCTGGTNGGTVAYLYDAAGNVIDVQGTATGPTETLKTITLDGSSARAERLEICFGYGGLFEVRFWFD